MKQKTVETFYCWREEKVVDGKRQLLIPRSDPYVFEHSFDLTFTTVNEALQALVDWEIPEDESKEWRLCLSTTETVDY